MAWANCEKRGAVLRHGCWLALFVAQICIQASLAAQPEYRSIEADGRTRSYLQYIPESVKKSASALVLVFHGGGSSGAGMARLTRFADLAERERFVVVFPNAWHRNWNDGRQSANIRSQRERIDDVAFVAAIMDRIRNETVIDPGRIFATGISNGAIFSHYLAGHLSERIAAIAPVVGGMARPYAPRFSPRAPVSVLVIQGTADPLVPYGGGTILGGRHGSIIGTDAALGKWVEHDRCHSDPRRDGLIDADPHDGCRVERKRWSGCAAGVEVELLREVGAGHTWPGGGQYLPSSVIGKVCRDLRATAYIWAFFKQHPKHSGQ